MNSFTTNIIIFIRRRSIRRREIRKEEVEEEEREKKKKQQKEFIKQHIILARTHRESKDA